MRIDDHMLAGYMAGDLTASDRQSVTMALLQDRNLREWLHMATEAMSAAGRSAHDNPLMRSMPAMEASRPGIRREDRRALPSRSRVRRTGTGH